MSLYVSRTCHDDVLDHNRYRRYLSIRLRPKKMVLGVLTVFSRHFPRMMSIPITEERVQRASFPFRKVVHTLGHLEKFLSPTPHESDSVTARGNGRMERAGHGAKRFFRC